MLLVESLLGTSSASQPIYVEEVFSPFLYTGTGAAQSIGNDIQLGTAATTSGWVATLGSGANSESATALAVDSSKNVYVTGYGNTSGPGQNFVTAKYNSSGAIQWQRSLGSTSAEYAYGIAVDSSGNSYICGTTVNAPTSSVELSVAKYDTSGVLQWQRKVFSTFYTDNGYSIAVDSSNNVYICGDTDASGTAEALIVKYNSSGTLQWQRTLTSSGGACNAYSLAVDSSDNVYVTGATVISAVNNLFVAKYNSAGTLQWQRFLTSGSATYGYGIAVDSSANVYVAGNSSIAGVQSGIIAKYNSSGTLQWQRSITSGSTTINGRAIAVDSSGNPYVALYASVSSNLDGYIIKYNTSGTLQWQRKFGTSSTDYLYSIQVDNAGSIYFCGYTEISSRGEFYLAKFPDDGSGTGAYKVNTVTFTYQESTFTSSTSTLTDSAGTLTSSTSALNEAATTLTDSAASYTSYVTTIPTGAGKGGMVWLKDRTQANPAFIMDTTRGTSSTLQPSTTGAAGAISTAITSFNGNGFSIGTNSNINTSPNNYVSWTFRKQAKFFDVVTVTADGSGNLTANHNLGSVPGSIFIKRTDGISDWDVWHRSLTATQVLKLNTTAAAGTRVSGWMNATSSSFTTSSGYYTAGATYVAYLFAHDAGGFGATGSDNVISCGSVTASAGGAISETNLGWEPQWVLYKRTDSTGDWQLFDTMRGLVTATNPTSTSNQVLYPNLANAEASSGSAFQPTATGFGADTGVPVNSTWIYIAIRRGPMKTPTTGTSVFGLNARDGTTVNATVLGGQTDDVILVKNRAQTVTDLISTRLTGTGYMVTSNTAAEVAAGTNILQANPWDVMDGVKIGTTSVLVNDSTTYINYLFRRAPGFFDVVCYTGTGANTTQTHNLGVAPELWIVKRRDAVQAPGWAVGSTQIPANSYLTLNLTDAYVTGATFWNSTYPTASNISLGTSSTVNASAATYVAYLFATVAGVSKVGSYTGTGTTKQIDCGFTSGARFVLIKRTDSAGDWYVWDTARGIVAGSDPYFLLNSANAENASTDYIDPYSAGFEISSSAPAAINANGGTFIFLAIA
jgi:uncharacterized delta-60 repeat protein